jgi:hypothetical protein
MEGKLRHLVGATAAQDAPIVNAGWLRQECESDITFAPDKLAIDVYGMSHSNHIADQLERLDPGLAVQRFAGPAAPLNHSYACFVYRDETGLLRAPIQIIGVLASSLRRILTITGLTTSFEQPMPFTYPRFRLRPDGGLSAHQPVLQSPEDLREALAGRQKWTAFLGQLASEDAFYAPGLMSSDFMDYSVLLRMVRRAWAQHVVRNRTASLGLTANFDIAPDLLAVMRAMVIDFARRARANGKRPLVLLFEDPGYGGAFSNTLEPTLRANRIEYVTSATFAPTNDPGKFLPDGHFTPAVDNEMARAVLALLNRTPVK